MMGLLSQTYTNKPTTTPLPRKTPFPLKHADAHLIHPSLDRFHLPTKWYPDPISCFTIIHPLDKPIDRPTDRQTNRETDRRARRQVCTNTCLRSIVLIESDVAKNTIYPEKNTKPMLGKVSLNK